MGIFSEDEVRSEKNDAPYVPEHSSDTTDLDNEKGYDFSHVKCEELERSSKSQSISYLNSTGLQPCDENEMHVEKSRGRNGDQKSNFCLYCHKKQMKIARHLQLKHKQEEDVKKFIDLPKKSIERRKIIEIIRKKGNYIFNTNKNYNDGELIVSRRPNPKFTRNALHYIACEPTVAFTLGTLLKQVGNILINEYIKKHDEQKKVNAENLLKLLGQEVLMGINRTVAESQFQFQRQKRTLLPSTEDIKKLNNYLTNLRKNALEQLKRGFCDEVWLNLNETTLSSVQLFNRRRAGEVERILIEDFFFISGNR
ncbi:hypothetical protein JTB14_035926 [Gonioctena quinquepunctata]|nr:hypothetical protein JTB14_035926 [Gonioctena quinquepunctata]